MPNKIARKYWVRGERSLTLYNSFKGTMEELQDFEKEFPEETQIDIECDHYYDSCHIDAKMTGYRMPTIEELKKARAKEKSDQLMKQRRAEQDAEKNRLRDLEDLARLKEMYPDA